MRWQEAVAASADKCAIRRAPEAALDHMIRWNETDCLVGGAPPEEFARAARPGECDGFDDWEPRRPLTARV